MDNDFKTRSPDEIKTAQDTNQEAKTPIEPPVATPKEETEALQEETIPISPPLVSPPLPPPLSPTPSSPSQPPSQPTRRPSSIDMANNMLRRTSSMINKPGHALQAGKLAVKKIIGLLGQMTIQSLLPILIPIVIMLIVLFLMLYGFLIIPGGNGTPSSSTGGPSGSSGTTIPGSSTITGVVSLASANLYNRGGKLVRIGNPQLAQIVSEIAAKADVPDILIMAILTRESEGLVTNTNLNCKLETDYCPTTSSKGAIGAMQIVPSTFKIVFERYKTDLKDKFIKIDKSLETSPHVFQDNDPVLRITSVRDSIITGAYEIKRLKEYNRQLADAPWDENTIRTIAARYHGGAAVDLAVGCSNNYCNDVWRSVNENQSNPVGDLFGIKRLVQSIIANPDCVNGINGGNFSICVNNIPSFLNRIGDVINEMRISVSNYISLQCLGFVQSLIPLVNYPNIGRYGSPPAMINNPPSAYQFIYKTSGDTIQVGDIPIWINPPSGHIAFVTEVFSNDRFEVADANWCPLNCGKIQLRRIYIPDDVFLAGWLRKR